MIMASRLLYGMARQGVVPPVLGRVHPTRRTPWVSIVFVAALACVLAVTGDLSALADTTVLLLLIVFAIVNVCALVLRRDDVAHDHFRAPTAMPLIGVVVSVAVMTTKDAETFARAGALLGAGAVLWIATSLARAR
jgi:amino acid transporter